MSTANSLTIEEIKKAYFVKPQIVYKGSDIDEILRHLTQVGVGKLNDMKFTVGRPISVKVNGIPFQINERPLGVEEVNAFINHITGDSSAAVSIINQNPRDPSYGIDVDPNNRRSERINFRVNASPFEHSLKGIAIDITIRVIDPVPPTIEMMGISEDMAHKMFPSKGLVLLVGETGSGKSSSLSAVIRHHAQNDDVGFWMLTFEDPVEYLHDTYPITNGTEITQTSVGGYASAMKDFGQALRSSLRRAPDVMQIGELRDHETVDIAMQICKSGHLCLGTIHANGPYSTIDRIAGYYKPENQQAKVIEVLSELRCLVVQYLAQKVGGGRIAIRDYLPLDDSDRKHLMREYRDGGGVSLQAAMENLTETKGYTQIQMAQKYLDEGVIDEIEYMKIQASR